MLHGGTGANIAGTQGGIPYFNSTNTMATSSQLLLNGIVGGGGAVRIIWGAGRSFPSNAT